MRRIDPARRVVLSYFIFSFLWILLSDHVVTLFISAPKTIALVSTIKGWFFVAVTSLLLYGLVRRLFSELNASLEALKHRERQLELSKYQLQATLDALPDLLFEVDQNGIIQNYHSHRSDLLAAPPEVFLGQHFFDVVPPEVADACRLAIDDAKTVGFSSGRSYSLMLPQGQHWFELSAAPMQIGTAEQRYILIARDITERRQASEKLQLASRVFSDAREGIVITNAEGIVLDVNEAFSRITGYAKQETVGQNLCALNTGQPDDIAWQTMWQSLQEVGYWNGEIWHRRKNGEMFPELLTLSAVRDAQGRITQYVGLFSDITSIKEHQKELEYLAHFDPLTGVPNRLLLLDRLQLAMHQEQRRDRHLGVVYLDLDGFKAINDRHGHDTGDQFLVAISRKLTHVLREGDTLARIGGDEFIAVLIDLEQPDAVQPLLQRLLETMAEPVHLDDLRLQISASLGVTFYPQEVDINADQLLRQADQAMYQAKLAGKNRFHVFDARQDSTIRSHHESIERIRQALEQHELLLHYQPKVHMRNGQIVGAEALLRWRHPDMGLQQPATFLPLIEDHTLAVTMGEWVIRSALGQLESWRKTGFQTSISVNVSARQLQQPDFVERLRRILGEFPAVPPSCLELEILETSAFKDINQVSQVIDACCAFGVTFAIDDFGTGYSSLTYLKRLQVRLLKIDQSFVRDMLDDPDDLAILTGVIGLAKAFELEVIAEGVETVAHGTALLKLGCTLAQGYGIARPMPGSDVPAWAARWQPDTAWQHHLGPMSENKPT